MDKSKLIYIYILVFNDDVAKDLETSMIAHQK